MAKSTISGLTITIGADTKQFSTSIKELDAEARNIAKDLKTVNENLKLDPTNASKAANSLKLLQEQAQKAGEKVKLIKDSIEKLNKAYANGEVSAEDYQKSINHLKMLLSQAKNEQDLVNEKIKQFGKNAEESGKGALSLGDIIKAHLTSSAIMAGLSKLADLAKTIARELAQAAKELWNFSKDAVSVAAQYQDAVEYSEKVFGGYADKVKKKEKENSANLRIAFADIQVYMNNLGTAFGALGLSHQEAMDYGEQLLNLSADIRAATGKGIDEIVNALTRGFTSSTKNFRQFGLYVSEADIKIQALKDGIIEYSGDQETLNQLMIAYTLAAADAQRALEQYGEESEQFTEAETKANEAMQKLNDLLGQEEVNLSSAERATSLYNLVLERLDFLVGQNEKEAGLYNSQIALLKTNFTNLKEQIGEQLLPVFTELITKFNEFLKSDEGQQIINNIVDAFKQWAETIKNMMDDGRMTQFINELIEKLPQIVTDIGNIINKVIELAPRVAEVAGDFLNIAHATANPTQYVGSGVGWENTGRTSYGRAGGGAVSAGQLYRVNDDAGRRSEWFIPAQNGYILNGNQTDRIMNSVNNSRNFSGGINIYVNSYGMNVAEVADELGAAFQNKMRMSGAML